MKIYPITNKINQITFGNIKDIQTPTETKGFLAVQNTDKLNFEKNLKLTNSADAVQSNPLKALGYKLVKAYNVLFTPKSAHETPDFHTPYYWIG